MFMTNLKIRHVCNDSSNGETSHTNLVAWQGRDANHNGNNSYYKNQTSAQCPSCGTYPDGNVTGGDDIEKGEEVTNMTSGQSAAGATTDMFENSLAEVAGSTNYCHDQLNSDNKCNDVVREEMQLAVGMVAQGDYDSGTAMVLDCGEIEASVLEAVTERCSDKGPLFPKVNTD